MASDGVDVDLLAEAVTDHLAAVQPAIDELSVCTLGASITSVVMRASLRRQAESLTAIGRLVASDEGFAAVPLLRPACEELIVGRYLALVSPSQSDAILQACAVKQVAHSLAAQRAMVGDDVIERLGLTDYLLRSTSKSEAADENFTRLRVELGWPAFRQAPGLPSTKWMARKTGSLDLYEYLFHATSRTVHFSVAELLRRAWYRDDGEITISSSQFERHWAAFALYEGSLLLAETAIVVWNVLESLGEGAPFDSLEQAAVLSATERIGKHGRVPIITALELAT
ncbi:MAG TPA: DUF5677 domain-containing protein [Microbacteriaceae bacterium]|jgi:hypothetical protein|nr:DUF5677 domain-containing protein [Microbacteriaceae bacterium]